MGKKVIDDILAKYDRDPNNPGQWVGVIYFERAHPQLASRKNQYVLRTSVKPTEHEIRAWCRTNLDAVTPAEVNSLLAQQDQLSVEPADRVVSRPAPPLQLPRPKKESTQ